MTGCNFRSLDEMKDPVSHMVYDLMRSYHMPKKLAFSFIKYGARDHARVPMQWDDSVNAGFNKGHEPWQCMNPDYKHINVEADLKAEKSVYRYYQKLLKIKKENETAVYGKTQEYDHEDRKVIAYSREYEENRLFIVANFSRHKVSYKLPEWVKSAEVLLDNYNDDSVRKDVIILNPYQATVFEKRK
jgi:oligo-1,6-glucosidase